MCDVYSRQTGCVIQRGIIFLVSGQANRVVAFPHRYDVNISYIFLTAKLHVQNCVLRNYRYIVTRTKLKIIRKIIKKKNKDNTSCMKFCLCLCRYICYFKQYILKFLSVLCAFRLFYARIILTHTFSPKGSCSRWPCIRRFSIDTCKLSLSLMDSSQ